MQWSLSVILNGVDMSQHLVGSITVEREQSTAAIASFELSAMAFGNISLVAYVGKSVAIDYINSETNQAKRVFTGIVDVPHFNIPNKTITFQCTDALQSKVKQMFADGTIWNDTNIVILTPNKLSLKYVEGYQNAFGTNPYLVDTQDYLDFQLGLDEGTAFINSQSTFTQTDFANLYKLDINYLNGFINGFTNGSTISYSGDLNSNAYFMYLDSFIWGKGIKVNDFDTGNINNGTVQGQCTISSPELIQGKADFNNAISYTLKANDRPLMSFNANHITEEESTRIKEYMVGYSMGILNINNKLQVDVSSSITSYTEIDVGLYEVKLDIASIVTNNNVNIDTLRFIDYSIPTSYQVHTIHTVNQDGTYSITSTMNSGLVIKLEYEEVIPV